MFNPNEEMAIMAERKRQLLKAARMHQLYNQADEERAQFGERLMALVGDLMSSGGQKLKARSGAHTQYTTAEMQNL